MMYKFVLVFISGLFATLTELALCTRKSEVYYMETLIPLTSSTAILERLSFSESIFILLKVKQEVNVTHRCFKQLDEKFL